MDSGYPALGTMPLAVSEMPHDQWFSVSVPVSELIKNAGSLPLNTSEIVSLFVLEPTSSAHVMVDNIELACGHPAKNGCGIRPPGGEVDSVLGASLHRLVRLHRSGIAVPVLTTRRWVATTASLIP